MFCVMNIQKRKKTDIGGIQKEATRTAAEYLDKAEQRELEELYKQNELER